MRGGPGLVAVEADGKVVVVLLEGGIKGESD